jgi:SAM-dependent methyltransferase
MADVYRSIQQQYGRNDLMDRVRSALQALGQDSANPTVEALNLVDQLHTGGLGSTKTQAKLAGITEGMRILDVGCGIGGSSRYLAHFHGCRVDAIDLTPQCVEASIRLNELCELSHLIAVCQGSVTEMSYGDQTFDIVWSQSVTMNVEDKMRMFGEVFRVVKPGGRFVFSHAAQGAAGEPHYPLPWATDRSYSFLSAPGQILQWLLDAGFTNVIVRIEAGGTGGAPHTVMGEDMPVRQANAIRSVQERRLVRTLFVADRPS